MIYALAARDGRDAVLFGSNAGAARWAFERSLAAPGFPELWFEMPLAGEPWFDVHALTAVEDAAHQAAMAQAATLQTAFPPQSTGGYPTAFEWFSRQGEDVRQMALSWDVGSGASVEPAIQLLVRNNDPSITCAFLESAGRPDAVPAYRAFRERIPNGWFACYAGVFGMRPDLHLRVECIPERGLQRAYAQDAALLKADLESIGVLGLDEEAVNRCSYLAGLPFQSEFQFDVGPDGAAGQTFAMSVRFAIPPGSADWQPFDVSGAAGELMRDVQAWGLADDRWKALEGCMYAMRASLGDESCLMCCYPAFAKLRWRNDIPLDAKVYLIAGLRDVKGSLGGGTLSVGGIPSVGGILSEDGDPSGASALMGESISLGADEATVEGIPQDRGSR